MRITGIFLSRYVGDGDSKIGPRLIQDPPYSDLKVCKLEDLNHFSKKMANRLEKIKQQLKGQMIDGRKGIGGPGRLTQSK
jgi:hypothetical protein